MNSFYNSFSFALSQIFRHCFLKQSRSTMFLVFSTAQSPLSSVT